MRLMKYGAITLAFFLICSDGLAPARSLEPDAQAVLQRMIRTYASAKSYQDSGLIRVVSSDPLIGKGTVPFLHTASMRLEPDILVSFKTYYLRPLRFRFEWKNPSDAATRESVIWSDGKRAYRWMPSVSGNDTFEYTDKSDLAFNLEWGLSSSLGSIFFVPTLLMKDITFAPFAGTLRMAKQTAIVGEESVEGEMCYVIKAHLSGVPWVLWIGKKSYLLRKTRTFYSARSFHDGPKKSEPVIAEEIHSNIRINQCVPKTLFKYRPMLQPRDLDLTGGTRRPRGWIDRRRSRVSLWSLCLRLQR